MKGRFTKKKLLVAGLLFLLVAGGGAGYWFFLRGDEAAPQTNEVVVSDEKKVTDLFQELSADSDYSKFYAFITGGTELTDKLVADANGQTPRYQLFAAPNDAFDAADVSGFETLTPAANDEFRQYYSAVYPADATGNPADLSLKDGQVITTIGGHQLHVKQHGKKFVVVDMKGREATVEKKYAVDASGNRLYYIDSLLLLQ